MCSKRKFWNFNSQKGPYTEITPKSQISDNTEIKAGMISCLKKKLSDWSKNVVAYKWN